ncbi:MAG: hypothetical protein J6C93_00415 [Clostridia bacterium]|nr:hypothetical protein [Clostridia bacterium]
MIASYLIPVLFLSLFSYALFKKVRLYDCFTDGIKQAVPLILSLFPYLCGVLMLSALFEQSGLSDVLTNAIAPVLSALGIPPELGKLVLMKPFSGSGATALLSEILSLHGADSYLGRCACVCFGSSETVFYLSAVYFSSAKGKKPVLPVVIALTVNFITVILGCFLCRFL